MRFGKRRLFRRLGFRLDSGESLAVTGANGSGKSTLMRVLAGVLTPTRGTVDLVVDGQAISKEQRPYAVGMVAPYLNVYDAFSTRENLRFLADARRLPDADARIDATLGRVGLAGRADDPVADFSTGLKQRARIAAALLADPALLLLDEPSSNLDAAGAAMVTRVLDEAMDRGAMVIVATNVADEAARCQRTLDVEAFRV